ncbi:MAG: hypothetical protein QXW41_07865 [Fervidicoccaceae archaeon]
MKKLADGILAAVTRRGDARDQLLDSLEKLVKAVIEAKPYIDDDRYEGVVDEVAAQWGLDVETFRTFVDNLYKLVVERVAAKEDLVRLRIREWLDALKREENMLEKKMRLLERNKNFRIGWLEDFEDGKIYHNIFVRGDKLYIRVKEENGYGEHEVVVSEAFRKAAERIRAGFIIVTGPKGIGKSTLVAWRLWQMLKNGEATSVIVAEGLERGERQLDLLDLLQACSYKYCGICGLPVVLYDLSPPISYVEPKEARAAKEVEDVLKFLKDVHERRGVPVVAVLPKDLLTDEVKRELGDFIIEVDLRDGELISGILDEYSGCRLDEGVKQQLVDKILQIDEGYALVARLAGEELRRSRCNVEDVNKLLENAQGAALAFIIRYVNKLLSVVVERDGLEIAIPERVRKLSILLAFRQSFADVAKPGEYITPSGLVKRWFDWERVFGHYEDYEEEGAWRRAVSRWLAVRHRDQIEKTLSYIKMISTNPDSREVWESLSKMPQPLMRALELWAIHGSKIRNKQVFPPGESLLEEAVTLFLEKYHGKLSEEVRPECWRRLAFMAGAALTAQPFKALAEAVEDGGEKGVAFGGLAKAVEKCGVDDLFLEGGELTLFSRALLVESAKPSFPYSVYAAVADKRKEVIQELRELWRRWEERGLLTLPESIYALGLAAVLSKIVERGKAKISKEDAGMAMRATSFGIQKVLAPGAVSIIVEALSPLGERAPDEWAALLSNASRRVGVGDVVKEKLDKLYESKAKELRRDWVKAYMADAYAWLGDADKACALLDGMKDGALKAITEAFIYDDLIAEGEECPGVDVCARLEKVVEELEGTGPVLQADEELMEYLKRRWISAPEKALGILLQEAMAFALSGLARCALDKGEFDKAVEYFSKAAEISRDLGEWENYLAARSLALRALALGALPDKAGELLSGFEELWREVLEHLEPTAPYLEKTAGVLGRYLVALALKGRHGDVEKLLREHGWVLRLIPFIDVAVKLTLRFLGARAEEPGPEDVLEAVRGDVEPSMLPALAEALGLGGYGTEYCAQFIGTKGELCIDAYSAVKGNSAARHVLELLARSALAEKGVPRDLLEKADAKRLAEAWAPRTSLARFVLLLRALSTGDVDAALLHAEAGRAEFKGKTLGMLYGELAEALRRGDKDALRAALAKLYYYHF